MQLELKNITKSYGSMLANDQVSLNVRKAGVHALLGENGAGKSTLVNILYGTVHADEGEIFWDGKPVEIHNPQQARKLGIGIVFQHFALFEALTVAENIALGIGYTGSRKKLLEHIEEVTAKYHLQIDSDRMIGQLSAGEKQRVEIIRCLLQNPKLLILDEPTSVLTTVETEQLFKTLNTLTSEGHSVLFISHKLEEVREICEEATILRGGKLVGTCKPKEMEIKEIAEMMVGSEIGDYLERKEHEEVPTLIQVRNKKPTDGEEGRAFYAEDLKIRQGCITGIAGIAGNGQDELMNFISGELLGDKDEILLRDEPIGNWDLNQRHLAGIMYVPTERLGRAAVPVMGLTENALLATTQKERFVDKYGLIDYGELKNFSNEIIKAFDVVTRGAHMEAHSLSGGNLQKYIVGRTILQNPKVLLISNPTWGVDIAAAIAIRNNIIKLRDQGVAILIASEDLEELFSICDELTVIKEGNLSESIPVNQTNMNEIGLMMTK
ncbi:MAG: ABC transporter ATP-binding protein [Proteobacteria bacterium]|nr:ABC transporter ATP-binding protein [Pseudomonadota bacterium]